MIKDKSTRDMIFKSLTHTINIGRVVKKRDTVYYSDDIRIGNKVFNGILTTKCEEEAILGKNIVLKVDDNLDVICSSNKLPIITISNLTLKRKQRVRKKQ